jgi:hypothetical protein
MSGMIEPFLLHLNFTDFDDFCANARNCDLSIRQSEAGDIDCRVAHAITKRVPTGHNRDSGGGTGGFRVHTRQAHALMREFVNAGGLITTDRIKCFVAEVTKTDVIDEDVEDIGRFAVILFAEFGQTLVQVFVFHRPAFTILFFQNVMLGIIGYIGGINRRKKLA